jgi:hypothetical protein
MREASPPRIADAAHHKENRLAPRGKTPRGLREPDKLAEAA